MSKNTKIPIKLSNLQELKHNIFFPFLANYYQIIENLNNIKNNNTIDLRFYILHPWVPVKAKFPSLGIHILSTRIRLLIPRPSTFQVSDHMKYLTMGTPVQMSKALSWLDITLHVQNSLESPSPTSFLQPGENCLTPFQSQSVINKSLLLT